MAKQSNTRPKTDTSDLLLTAAAELMSERRSTDITLNEIAARSGVNAALIGYYFGNKSGLFMALLHKTLDPGIKQIVHLREMNTHPIQKMRIHISGIINSYFQFPFVNHLMHQMLADDPVVNGPKIAKEFSRPVAEAQRAILDEGVSKGIFLAVDPMMFYFHLVGACDQLFYGRYQLEHVFGVTVVDDDLKRKYIDHVSTLLLKGIMIHPEDYNPGTAQSA